MTFSEHLIYMLLWLSFGVIHSLTAGPRAKTILEPYLGRYYRLLYNTFAALHVGAIIVGGKVWLGSNAINFPLFADFKPLFLALQIIGVIVLYFALKQYDKGLFLGFKQLRSSHTENIIDGAEPLNISGLNAYVRHPIYTGSFLLLWGLCWNEFGSATAFWGSFYLVIGTYFEERKLLRLYGQQYQDYKSSIPAFFPWPKFKFGRD